MWSVLWWCLGHRKQQGERDWCKGAWTSEARLTLRQMGGSSTSLPNAWCTSAPGCERFYRRNKAITCCVISSHTALLSLIFNCEGDNQTAEQLQQGVGGCVILNRSDPCPPVGFLRGGKLTFGGKPGIWHEHTQKSFKRNTFKDILDSCR